MGLHGRNGPRLPPSLLPSRLPPPLLHLLQSSLPLSGVTGPALLRQLCRPPSLPPRLSRPLSLLRPLSAPQSGTTGPALLHPSPPPPLRSSAATPLPLLLQLPHTLALPATTSPPLP